MYDGFWGLYENIALSIALLSWLVTFFVTFVRIPIAIWEFFRGNTHGLSLSHSMLDWIVGHITLTETKHTGFRVLTDFLFFFMIALVIAPFWPLAVPTFIYLIVRERNKRRVERARHIVKIAYGKK